MKPARRERKVVTVLFADLVDFTSQAEALDPEDVEAILGAPVSHEDDPERAVRAALAIRDWAREQGDVQVRIAVNTGEALINLDARPESGEGIAAGDVVNTAARMQTAAPTNGIVVGEATYRATRSAIDYRESGTALLEAGARVEADVQLQRALAFFRSAGATRCVLEGEALLTATA